MEPGDPCGDNESLFANAPTFLSAIFIGCSRLDCLFELHPMPGGLFDTAKVFGSDARVQKRLSIL